MSIGPLTRRAAIRFGFGAAVAAPSAVAQLEQHVRLGHGLGGGGLFAQSQPPTVAYPEESLLKKAARKLFYRERENMDLQSRYRAGALDHDIAAMGSWSLAAKAAAQKKRDDERRARLETLRFNVWGEED